LEPFFLLGAERDGLLLLELMLAAHPELAWRGGFDYALEWHGDDSEEGPPLVPYWRHLALSLRARQLGVRIDPTLDFPALVRSLLEEQRGGSAPPYGVSLHAHYERALRFWPRARFVHLGRAVPRGDAEWHRLRESERAWRRIAAEIAPERRLELRYETLLADLAGQLARVCAFLGVRFDTPVQAAPAPRAARAEPPPQPISAAPLRFARGLAVRVARLLGG
jgi:hypothetical protein